MNGVQAACPGCGAPIEFAIGSALLKVCEHCQSLVARGDQKLEDLGKVSLLVQTQSPLKLGAEGTFHGQSCEVAGRIQYQHQAGGVWNEWYLHLANDDWLWLAEAQGRFFETAPLKLKKADAVPPFESLRLGQRFTIPTVGKFTIAEIGIAQLQAAEGEIPFVVFPNQPHPYADLSGDHDRYATLDYSQNPPAIYTGREITLDQLGFSADPDEPPPSIEALQISCPSCGGSLELKAPNEAMTVTCPFCSDMHNVDQGNLQFLCSLKDVPGKMAQLIPLGSKGKLLGEEYTVLGFIQRYVTFDRKYYWQEYLLYQPKVGFRWLVHSDNHWSFVDPVPPGRVTTVGNSARWQGKDFAIFQKAIATVSYVAGEFYWKVRLNERVQAWDYICPPYFLSREKTLPAKKPKRNKTTQSATVMEAIITGEAEAAAGVLPPILDPSTRDQDDDRDESDAFQAFASHPITGGSQADQGEINWSLGTYLPVQDVQQAFGLKSLPSPIGVAPNQPRMQHRIYQAWMILSALVIMATLFIWEMKSVHRVVFDREFSLALPSAPPIDPLTVAPVTPDEKSQVYFSEPFDLNGYYNILITAWSPVDNSWVYFDGDLYNEETGLVQTFAVPIEYYHGVDSDGSWSEGSQNGYAYVSSMPTGKYTLRLEMLRDTAGSSTIPLKVRIEQGCPRLLWPILILCFLTLGPACIKIWEWSIESQRWKDSDFSPYSSS